MTIEITIAQKIDRLIYLCYETRVEPARIIMSVDVFARFQNEVQETMPLFPQGSPETAQLRFQYKGLPISLVARTAFLDVAFEDWSMARAFAGKIWAETFGKLAQSECIGPVTIKDFDCWKINDKET